jgi:hypothetical protein
VMVPTKIQGRHVPAGHIRVKKRKKRIVRK